VDGYRSPILAMRKAFDLYANLRPVQSLPGKFSRLNLDLLIVRENTEGLYAGRERLEGDTAIAERVITRKGSRRIVTMAFEQARKRNRGSGIRNRETVVTIVHKANVLKVSDGLFRECALEVAKAYPDVALKELLIDTMAMRLVSDPESFDVIVTTNLFAAFYPTRRRDRRARRGASANIGEGRVRGSVAPRRHCRAGIASPIGTILSARHCCSITLAGDTADRCVAGCHDRAGRCRAIWAVWPNMMLPGALSAI
jgi:homoisocitrate dehydrogenase